MSLAVDMIDSDFHSTLSDHSRTAGDAEMVPVATNADPEVKGGWLSCIFLLLLFSPLIAFLGAMRWHIPNQLDGDLRFIFCWFVDAFLYFLVAYPFYITARNGIVKGVFERLSNGAYTAVFVAAIVAVAAFVVATFFAFHYLVSELLKGIS